MVNSYGTNEWFTNIIQRRDPDKITSISKLVRTRWKSQDRRKLGSVEWYVISVSLFNETGFTVDDLEKEV